MICLSNAVYLSNSLGQAVCTIMWFVMYHRINKRRDDLYQRISTLELWVTLNDKQLLRKYDELHNSNTKTEG